MYLSRFIFLSFFDGDTLEERNLQRQLFPREAVARNKATALATAYAQEYANLRAEPHYFHDGIEIADNSLLFVCVDNHAARRAALSACDRYSSDAIIAANEYNDSSAIWYSFFNKNTPLDPRIRYPEILTDEGGDPTRPQGCNTDEALAAAPQLAIANFAAASHALQLFWFYCFARKKMDRTSRPHWPIEHSNNFNKITTRTEEAYATN